MRTSWFLRFVPCLVIVSLTASAADWTTSGGDRSRTGLSAEIGPDTSTILWQGTLDGWFGAPIFISGDRLVTMRFQGIDYAPIVCHDLATGDTIWTRDFPGSQSRSVPIGFNDDRVYAMNFQELTTQKDTLYALDASDGHILWTSPIRVNMSISESVSYAPDGDLLVTADSFRIARINATDGAVVWTTGRVWPVTGSADIVAWGDRLYAYGGDIGSFHLISYDVATGIPQDTVTIRDTHPGGPMPQAAPMIGPDGTIYAHKVGDNVTAVRDFGDSLHVLWEAEISGTAPLYAPFAHFAVGPDSTVYAASWGRIIRLDPATGTILDSSKFIQDTSQVVFHIRISIDAEGTVYASSGGNPPTGGLYAFTPDLRLRWYDGVSRLNTCGPAIGPGGLLAVAGNGTQLRVYQPLTGIEERPYAYTRPAARAIPNPFRNSTSIRYELRRPTSVSLTVCNIAGQEVQRLDLGNRPAGRHRFKWDGRDRKGLDLPPGVYLCRIDGGPAVQTVRLIRTN